MSLYNGKRDPLQFLKFYDIENPVRFEDFGFPTVQASTTTCVKASTSKLMYLVHLQHKDCDADPVKCFKVVKKNQK
jgi:hypothetical protein